MAVLIEGISIVIRIQALLNKFPGGWNAFVLVVPNKTLCSDNEIARVGFMTPHDVKAFVTKLEHSGLEFLRAGNPIDLAVVDQHQGPMRPCDWLEFGHVNISPAAKVAACRLVGSQAMELATPNGWKYEGSLSASHGFVPNEDVPKNLEFLRHEKGVDVYLDRTSGKEVYIGRTSK